MEQKSGAQISKKALSLTVVPYSKWVKWLLSLWL
jgi:hypothetical protein